VFISSLFHLQYLHLAHLVIMTCFPILIIVFSCFRALVFSHLFLAFYSFPIHSLAFSMKFMIFYWLKKLRIFYLKKILANIHLNLIQQLIRHRIICFEIKMNKVNLLKLLLLIF